jgi:hypothetical protein
VINKLNKKWRKCNKMLSKNEKGAEKNLTKDNKKEGTKHQVFGTRITSFHSLISNAISLVIQ